MNFASPTTWCSAAILAVLAAAPLARFAWHYRTQNHYPWPLVPFYLIYQFFTRIVWGAQINTPLPVQPGQGAIIVCNHVSSIDPWFVQLGVHQIVHWMVAREYSLHPKMAWIFRSVGAIPVNRSGVDIAATKLAIRYAKSGELVGLFPEGRINNTQDLLLPGRPGVALVALRARVPVIPCFVRGAPYDGTEFGCFGMWARARVTVGQPIDLSPFYDRSHEKDVLEDATRLLLREMARLAGDEDFEPQLAGRFWKPGMAAQ